MPIRDLAMVDEQNLINEIRGYEITQTAQATALQSTSLTWSQVGTGLGIVSTAVSAYGGYKAYNDKADSLDEQARLDDLQAAKILELSLNTIGMINQKQQKVTATQQTTLIGRGVSASGNLSLAVQSESIDQARQEMANVDRQGQYENYMMRMKAQSARDAADAARSAGTMSLISGALTIGATVLGGPMAGMAMGTLTSQSAKG